MTQRQDYREVAKNVQMEPCLVRHAGLQPSPGREAHKCHENAGDHSRGQPRLAEEEGHLGERIATRAHGVRSDQRDGMHSQAERGDHAGPAVPAEHSVEAITPLQPRQPGGKSKTPKGGQASGEPGQLSNAGECAGRRGTHQVPTAVGHPQHQCSGGNADDDSGDVWADQWAGWWSR